MASNNDKKKKRPTRLSPYRQDLPARETDSPAGRLTLASENQSLIWKQPSSPA